MSLGSGAPLGKVFVMPLHKFSNREREKYAAMDEHVKVNMLQYLWDKQQQHIKNGYTKESFCITDAELVKDFQKYGPRYGLWVAEKLLAIGYLEISGPVAPQLSTYGKMKQFISKMFPKITERSGR